MLIGRVVLVVGGFIVVNSQRLVGNLCSSQSFSFTKYLHKNTLCKTLEFLSLQFSKMSFEIYVFFLKHGIGMSEY